MEAQLVQGELAAGNELLPALKISRMLAAGGTPNLQAVKPAAQLLRPEPQSGFEQHMHAQNLVAFGSHHNSFSTKGKTYQRPKAPGPTLPVLITLT